jgi:hypothetical protein
MPIKRLAFAALAASVLLPGATPTGRLQAQVTTGSVTGVVTNEANQPVPGVQVQVQNTATGISRGAVTRDDGRFFVAGLEVGGGYTVTARRIGFAPLGQSNVRVPLGQAARVDLRLQTQAAQLSTVQVTAASSATGAIISPDRRDVRTTISDTALIRLPTISRNFADFVALTPQISTSGGGLAAGTNNRFNTVRIDGANATDLFGLGSTGQPGGQAGGRSIPLEAVREYQVLLTPFDVRQGLFSGAVINAVTKSGTNKFEGSLIGTTRNQNFSQNVPVIRGQPFLQQNYGATLGGPIVRDKAFFFVSSEFQKQSIVATGPYFGQPAGSPSPVPVSDADYQAFTQILSQQYGIGNVGLPTQIRNRNPLANVFARTDFNLSGSTRLVLRYNYAAAKQDNFSRGTTNLRLSTNGYNFQNSTNAPYLQLYSNFANGNYNELFAGLTSTRDKRVVPVVLPQISVGVNNPNGGQASITTGTENSSQGNSLDQDVYELTDNFSFSRGGHRVTVGSQNQFYKVRNLFSQNSYGNYSFGTLDSLRLGLPNSYQIGVRLAGPPDARFRTANFSGYAQDEWTVSNRVNVQYGVRLDLPAFYNAPGFNALVDTVKLYGTTGRAYPGRETNTKPASKLLFSPRLGFNADVNGDQSLQLRGGAGLFAGLPPYVFLSNVFANNGVDTYGNVQCLNAATAPQFVSDPSKQTPGCKPGTTVTQAPYAINSIDPNLKLPQYFKGSLGLDRAVGAGFVLTLEGLYTRAVNGLFYQNLAVQTVTGTDRNGRLLYGDYDQARGNAIPYTAEYGTAASLFSADGRRTTNGRPTFIDVTNQSKDYSYSLTSQLHKRFSDRFEGSLAYTFSRTYDVQSLTSSVALSNWRFGRPVSGNLYDKSVGVSNFDTPHRIIFNGTYTFPTKTDLSLVYIGQSGQPYSFVYSGFDANFDGFNGNDLIYVPRSVYDQNEIRFSPQRGTPAAGAAANIAAQQAAFDRLIQSTDCLSNARGTIIGRNTCRSPFTHLVNANVTQALPSFRGQNVEVRLDILNLGNLLNKNWGKQYAPSSTLAPLSGNGPLGSSGKYASARGANGNQQQFIFNPNYQLYQLQNPTLNSYAPGSYYQMQLGLAYRF